MRAYSLADIIATILPTEPDIQRWILDRDPASISTLVDTVAHLIKHCRQLDIGERDLIDSIAEPLRKLDPYVKQADGSLQRLSSWGLVYQSVTRAFALTSAALDGDKDALWVLAERLRQYQPTGHLWPGTER